MTKSLVLLAAVALVVSGCAGESGSVAQDSETVAPSDLDQPKGAETGSIRGVVVNDEAQPVAKAQAALLDVPGETFETLTDEAGAFAFAEVPPGSHRLAVSALGYEAASRQVEVRAGETTDGVRLVLKSIAIETSTHKTEQVSGFVGCSATIATSVPQQPAVTWVCGEAALGTSWYPNQNNQHTWKVPKAYETHLAELDWKMTSAMAEKMRMLLSTIIDCTPVVCLVATAYNQEVNGPRVLKIRVEYDEHKDLGRDFDMKARVRSGIPTGPGAAVVLDQKYTIYVTNFFGEAGPEDFTAAPPEPA